MSVRRPSVCPPDGVALPAFVWSPRIRAHQVKFNIILVSLEPLYYPPLYYTTYTNIIDAVEVIKVCNISLINLPAILFPAITFRPRIPRLGPARRYISSWDIFNPHFFTGTGYAESMHGVINYYMNIRNPGRRLLKRMIIRVVSNRLR